MQFSVANLALGFVVPVSTLALVLYWLLAGRRDAREQAEWEAMEASLRDMDGELDRVWANETGQAPRRL